MFDSTANLTPQAPLDEIPARLTKIKPGRVRSVVTFEVDTEDLQLLIDAHLVSRYALLKLEA